MRYKTFILMFLVIVSGCTFEELSPVIETGMACQRPLEQTRCWNNTLQICQFRCRDPGAVQPCVRSTFNLEWFTVINCSEKGLSCQYQEISGLGVPRPDCI